MHDLQRRLEESPNTIFRDSIVSPSKRNHARMWLGDSPAPPDPLRMFGIAEPGLG